MRIGEEDGGRSVDLNLGQTLEIRLAENPTTGYRWHVESDGSPLCTLMSDAYESSSSLPGSDGTRALCFRADGSGECNIALVCRRPWEVAASTARTFAVRVRVTDEVAKR